jgi:dTDP-4-amino-4,6-dideoxygalactose transaminase
LAQKIIPYLSTPDSQPVQHLLVIKAEKRDQLRRFLAKNQIETIIHYPVPLHQVPAFAPFVNRAESFPTAEMLAKKKVSLPFHQYLTKKEIDKIIHLLETFYAQ